MMAAVMDFSPPDRRRLLIASVNRRGHWSTGI
jgi:hypothetical protein